MIILISPVLVLFVGLIMYLACTRPGGNAAVARIGEIMFFCGLLACCFAMATGAWTRLF